MNCRAKEPGGGVNAARGRKEFADRRVGKRSEGGARIHHASVWRLEAVFGEREPSADREERGAAEANQRIEAGGGDAAAGVAGEREKSGGGQKTVCTASSENAVAYKAVEDR